MNKRRWLIVAGVVTLAGCAGYILSQRFNERAPNKYSQNKVEPQAIGSHEPHEGPPVSGKADGERRKSFRALSVTERNALLSEIRRRPLREIFDLWQRAGTIENDLMKQGAIATAMAYALRQQNPPQGFLDDMWHYVVDPQNSLRERSSVIGIFGGAKTVDGIEFVLKAAGNVPDVQLRRIANEQIASTGDLWGDGSYHEERSPPLERAWQTTSDPDLLSRIAISMSKIGAHSAMDTLLSAALDDSQSNSVHKRAALFGLEEVYSRNATQPVASLLACQDSANDASALASKLLVKIGDEVAAKALTSWFQKADASAVELAATSVARTRTPDLLDAWKALSASNQAFRSEEIRTAIREALKRYNRSISIEK